MFNRLFFAITTLLFLGANWAEFLPQLQQIEVSPDVPVQWSPAEGIAWTAEIVGDGQSSPVIWNDAVIVTSVDGYDLDTGNVLWSIDGLAGNTVATPSKVDETSFIVGASPGRDGKDAGPAAESNLLVRVAQVDDKWQATIPWRAQKALASFSTPITHQGLGYWINRTGVAPCATGLGSHGAFIFRLANLQTTGHLEPIRSSILHFIFRLTPRAP